MNSEQQTVISGMFRNTLQFRQNRKVKGRMDTDPAFHAARVAQLATLYAEREPLEISPFDDDSANMETFEALYEVTQ